MAALKWLLVILIANRTLAQGTAKDTTIMCKSGNSCENRCVDYLVTEGGKTPPKCHCDPYCTMLNDCCADYDQQCRSGNETNPRVEPGKMQPTAWRCYRYTSAEENPGIWMKASCPDSYRDNDTRAKCEEAGERAVTSLAPDLLLSVPTVYCHGNPGEDCVTFRNVYCAQCNGVTNPSFWKITWKCDFKPPDSYNQTEKIDFLIKYCKDFRLKPREQAPFRRYCYNVTSECSHDNIDSAAESACVNGSVGLVYDKSTNQEYRNFHCLLCNGGDRGDIQCGPRSTSDDVFNPKSFEILLQFAISPWGPKKTSVQDFPMTPSCKNGKVYDVSLEECRSASHLDPRQSIVDKFRFKLWMDGSSRNRSLDLGLFRDAMVKNFRISSKSIEIVSWNFEEWSIAVVFGVSAVNNSKNGTSLKKSPLFQFHEPFDLRIGNTTWRVFKITHRLMACTSPQVYPPGQYTISGRNVTLTGINGNKTADIEQVQLLTRNNSELGITAGSLFVCWSFFASVCHKDQILLGLELTDYKLYANGTLLFKASGVMYSTGEYDIHGTIAWVCTNYTEQNTRKATMNHKESTSDPVLWYFTVCGLPVSIICIAFLLATYVIFKELHTLPGKNLMSLCASLGLSQFFWLLASGETSHPMFCHVSAMILQYLFLVTFTSMSVIAYDTRRAFPQHQAPIAHNTFPSASNLRLLCYLAFAWGLPLAYVLLCVILDNVDIVAIGYGNSFNCWLSNPTEEMIFFGVPVTVSLLFNLGAFVRTVRAIRSTKKGSQRLSKHSGNQADEVKIYFRLLTLMGFTWFFGLGANLIHPYLRYPFVILTSLHGVYLALAFAFKPHVFKLYRDKLDSLHVVTSKKNTVSFVESNSVQSGGVESVL